MHECAYSQCNETIKLSKADMGWPLDGCTGKPLFSKDLAGTGSQNCPPFGSREMAPVYLGRAALRVFEANF